MIEKAVAAVVGVVRQAGEADALGLGLELRIQLGGLVLEVLDTGVDRVALGRLGGIALSEQRVDFTRHAVGGVAEQFG